MARHRSPGGRGTYPVPAQAAPHRRARNAGAGSVSAAALTQALLAERAGAVALLERPEAPAPEAFALPAPRPAPDATVDLFTPRQPALVDLFTPRQPTPLDPELVAAVDTALAGIDTAADGRPDGPAPAGDSPVHAGDSPARADADATQPAGVGTAAGPRPAGDAPAGLAPDEAPAATPDDAPARTRAASLRRGAVAVAVAGGTLALVAASLPTALPEGSLAGAAAALSLTTDASDPGESGDATVAPTPAHPDILDPQALVTAVTDAQSKLTEKAAADKKAADQAAAEKAAADKAAADKKAAAEKAAAVTSCGLDEGGLGAVKPFVRTAAQLVGCRFGKPTMYGVAGRGGASDHPSGKAVDFMVDRTTGDALAACVLQNRAALGVTYVIWRQRINFGSGWEAMEDRGGVTANHFDHVHVSFGSGGGAKGLTGC